MGLKHYCIKKVNEGPVPSLREEGRGRAPPNDCLCSPISVHSEYVFGTSRSDNTTGNNEKRIITSVGNQTFPSTTKKSNTHVHQPHFLMLTTSCETKKNHVWENSPYILAKKKTKKNESRGRSEKERGKRVLKKKNKRMWGTTLPHSKRTQK